MIAPINKIIDTSFVDGPGNRTVIFFQACNFHCKYCHNPETIKECIHCGICVPGCPTAALTSENSKIKWNDKECIDYGQCYLVCPHNSTPRIHYWTPDDVMKRVRKNMPFIRGISVSGGECSLYIDFIIELFRKAKDIGLHTLMDTNGSIPIARNKDLMAVTDGIMLDVKATDPIFHQDLTKHDNNIVMQNLLELGKMGKLVEIRTLVLRDNPYSKRTVEDVVKIMETNFPGNNIVYRLIKFRSIGVRGEAATWLSPTTEQMEMLKGIADNKGFKKVIIT